MHYAWCQARLARCTASQGPGAYAHDVEADPASDPALRWPGYVGAGWRPGAGVLFIGSVHADFTRLGGGAGDASRISTVRDLATANRAYVGAKVGDQAARRRFLDVSRQAYTELAPGWTRAGVLHDLLEVVMPNEEPLARFEGAAWTNLAHCRARPGETVGGEYLLQQKCSGSKGAFPLEVLVGILWPAACRGLRRCPPWLPSPRLQRVRMPGACASSAQAGWLCEQADPGVEPVQLRAPELGFSSLLSQLRTSSVACTSSSL